jgi:hypothetical protein
MISYRLLIDANGDTVGTYRSSSAPAIGDVVTVHACDENGNAIEVTGPVSEILHP